jgi:hypothetical protein
MDHQKHRAGTVQACDQCVEIAYEPAWYAALLSFMERSLGRSRVDDRVPAKT